jgi:segregation and condensation protein A
MDGLNMELAAEYLVMAAVLAEIKSRLLLPRKADEQNEEEDPRATLIRRLQEYEAIKIAAEELDALPRLERDIFTVTIDRSTINIAQSFPEVSLNEVLSAFRDMLKRVDNLSHHAISREPLSVRERMSSILQTLNSVASCAFSQLFTLAEGRSGVVVTFLAVLELSKEGLIRLEQSEAYSELRVGRANAY